MKTIRVILIGVAIWILAVSAYTISFYLPILEDVELQANLVLLLSVIPLVWYGSAMYYKKEKGTHGFLVGLTFLLVSAILDALITVPVFMMPNGIDHYMFFTAPGFWLIALVFISIVVLYYYFRVTNSTVTVKK
ncbi:DUF5367 family protein [Winogradskyella sp.]|uniref:DUF5367 family protein n=1 Tax=Winogradskyella sp. TaxID=1883156 RepID=UPI003BAC8859